VARSADSISLIISNKIMRPENLLNLDFKHESALFAKLGYPIIDVHSHINGLRAVELYAQAARQYGVQLTYSMTQLEGLSEVRSVLGDTIKFIAIPNWMSSDPVFEHTLGYNERLKSFWNEGSRIAKFWSAPRIFDHGQNLNGESLPHHKHPLRLNSPARLAAISLAVDMGYKIMVHVSDPDTWFATKYKDQTKYGSKEWHYEVLEEILSHVAPCPLIAAHMAGSPEDLVRLSRLLESHHNLYLDSSATKWQVRELSKHQPAILQAFFARWKGRILFGSDIVTAEAHLQSGEKAHEMFAKASTEHQAYDLYASRYWALRKLFETDYSSSSPIADPDLQMVSPNDFTELSSPNIQGCSLPAETLKALYHDAAVALLGN